MSHIIESCPFTKLYGGLSQLHPADNGALTGSRIMDLNISHMKKNKSKQSAVRDLWLQQITTSDTKTRTKQSRVTIDKKKNKEQVWE